MKGLQKKQFVISLVFVLVFSSLAVIHAKSSLDDKEKIIEVCANGIVYLPPGTKLVKCYRKIMKIIRITPYLAELEQQTKDGGEDCHCPRCCDGECYIVVSCEGAHEESAYSDSYASENESGSNMGVLCAVWLFCD